MRVPGMPVESNCVSLSFGSARGVHEFSKVADEFGAIFREGRPWEGEPDVICGSDSQIRDVLRAFTSRWGDRFAFRVHAAGEFKAFEVWE